MFMLGGRGRNKGRVVNGLGKGRKRRRGRGIGLKKCKIGGCYGVYVGYEGKV